MLTHMFLETAFFLNLDAEQAEVQSICTMTGHDAISHVTQALAQSRWICAVLEWKVTQRLKFCQ